MDITTLIHTILVTVTITISATDTVEEDILAVTGEYEYFYSIDKLV